MSRRVRVELRCLEPVPERGVGGVGRFGSVWDRLRFFFPPPPLPTYSGSDSDRPSHSAVVARRASGLFPVRLFRVHEGRYVVTGF